MTTPSRDFNDTWTQVVDMLIRGTDVRDGEPQPLTTQHKALLRSVQPVGQLNGFVLLATGSEMVQTLVKEELSERIERALDVITGRPQQVVVTISEDSSHADKSHADTSQADTSHADAPHRPRPMETPRTPHTRMPTAPAASTRPPAMIPGPGAPSSSNATPATPHS